MSYYDYSFPQRVTALRLYIQGKDLNPDVQEPPVVQITGVRTECIASTFQASGTHAATIWGTM
jgi:hypothetical protein